MRSHSAIRRELRTAGHDPQKAGQALASTLLHIGLGDAPGADVGRAGQWLLHDQHSQVLRRRDELLKQPAQPEPPAAGTAEAHAAALKTHPPGRNYDPDVIDKYPEFGPWWRKMNGLGPRRDPD